jgi:hypothetical protein
MAASERSMLAIVLAGSILLYVDLLRMRLDPLAIAVAGGLVVVASLSVGAFYASIDW